MTVDEMCCMIKFQHSVSAYAHGVVWMKMKITLSGWVMKRTSGRRGGTGFPHAKSTFLTFNYPEYW